MLLSAAVVSQKLKLRGSFENKAKPFFSPGRLMLASLTCQQMPCDLAGPILGHD